jgi:ribonucleotide reductase beta subunit family protein with ferritin-like domain
LSENDKHFLTYTLAFFAQADGIVLDNVRENFSFDNGDIPEAKIFYGIQSGIEAIHWEIYSVLIDTLIDDPIKKSTALSAIEHYPCIRKKAEWMLKWMGSNSSIEKRLIAFACAEGIFFSSAFASIFYYKKKGIMAGLVLSNTFIARDEGIHRDFGCELFKTLNKRNITSEVLEIVKDAVNIECEFVNESLNVSLIGINKESMCDYVKFVADHLLIELDMPKYYNVKNPFEWMSMISLTSKQNFFEGRVSEYKKTQSTMEFNLSSDF